MTNSLANTSRSSTQRWAVSTRAARLKRLQAVGVGPLVAAGGAQQLVVDPGAQPADQRALVVRADHALAAHHQVGVGALQQGQRPGVELGVAQVDLVADDEGPPRGQDPGLHRQAVVGLAHRQHAAPRGARPRSPCRSRRSGRASRSRTAGSRSCSRERPQLLPQLQHRAAQDPLLVVDGDDDREVGGLAGGAPVRADDMAASATSAANPASSRMSFSTPPAVTAGPAPAPRITSGLR